MMWTLKLVRHQRARVWLGEEPPAGYLAEKVLRRVVPGGAFVPTVDQIAAVELVVPRGAMAGYGLLGGKLVADGRHRTDIVVAVNQDGESMVNSFAVMPDSVRVGLLDEYAVAACSGVERVVREGWRFDGELNLQWAAHGAAGSSPSLFADLGTMVARLLALAKPPSEEALVSLLSRSVSASKGYGHPDG